MFLAIVRVQSGGNRLDDPDRLLQKGDTLTERNIDIENIGAQSGDVSGVDLHSPKVSVHRCIQIDSACVGGGRPIPTPGSADSSPFGDQRFSKTRPGDGVEVLQHGLERIGPGGSVHGFYRRDRLREVGAIDRGVGF